MARIDCFRVYTWCCWCLLGIHGNDSLGPDSYRDVVKESLSQLFLHRLHVSFIQVGSQQAHTTINVKPYTTCTGASSLLAQYLHSHACTGT